MHASPASDAAIAQGVQKVAKELIFSYMRVKNLAGLLQPESIQREQLVDGDGEEIWDLQLTLRTVEFNRTRLERLKLAGTRCGVLLFEVAWLLAPVWRKLWPLDSRRPPSKTPSAYIPRV